MSKMFIPLPFVTMFETHKRRPHRPQSIYILDQADALSL